MGPPWDLALSEIPHLSKFEKVVEVKQFPGYTISRYFLVVLEIK